MTSCIVSTNPKVYSGFSPTNIPGCELWLDGSDPNGNGTAPSDGASISTWVDKSRGGNSLTVAGTGTPTYVSATKNISYSGTSWFQKTGMTISSTFTFFAVATKTSGAGPVFTNTTTTDRTGFIPRFSNGQTYVVKDNANWLVYTSTFTDGTTYLYSITYDASSNINVWGNGSLFATNTQSATITRDSIIIGKRNVGGGENWIGTFSEILQYSTTPTTAQRQQIEGYLARKWGLTANLPNTHPFKSTPLFTRLLQPTDIEGCALWLDAADTSTLTLSGSNVTQWRDKSGNAYAFVQQGTFALPTFSNAGIASKGAVSFVGNTIQNDAANQILTNSTFPINSSASGYSIFAVAVQNASHPSYNNYNYLLSTYGGSGLFYGTEPSGYLVTANGTAGATFGFNDLTANVPNTSMTTVSQTSMIVSGSVLTPYTNGSVMTTKTGTCIALTGLNLGNAYAPGQTYTGQTWGGLIGEIIIYNAALTSIQRQQVEGYLAWKWGLQGSLPSTQAFKLYRTPISIFTPLQLSNCVLWLDAADASTLTLSGSSVTQWNDKSGTGYAGVFSTGRNFTYATSIRNGLNVVQTATGQTMTIANFAIGTTGSFFHVYMPINQSSDSAFIEQGPNVSTNDGFFFQSQTNNNFAYRNNAAITTTNFGTTAVSNTWELIEAINKDPNASNTMSYYSNGTLKASGGNTTNNLTITNTLYINGRNNTDTLSYPTYIGEIIIYNVALTNTQRLQLEGYLAWKWGLQGSLPSTHPYSKIRP